MINRNVVRGALARMSPEAQQVAEADAKRRGVPVEDIVLEQCLSQVEEQLYALRHSPRPALRVV